MPRPTPVSPPGGGADTTFRPTLFLIGSERQAPEAACASCPAAIWYQDKETQCFCNIMKMQTWPRSNAIVACDGREAAVARWEEEQTEA